MPSYEFEPIYVGNTSRVRLSRLKNPEIGELSSDATVTFTLFDPDGVVVSGLENQVMSLISAGNYAGTIPDTADITAAEPGSDPRIYKTVITASIAGVGVGKWTVERIAQIRREQ